MSTRLKIAVVVQGRFHAFDMARALLGLGHDVGVFTNYPRWAVGRFGLSADNVRCIPSHGVTSRIVAAAASPRLARAWEPIAHRMFGRWAARELMRERWDAIHCWSGVSEEILESTAASEALTLLMRGSSHVTTQRRLLDEESARVGVDLDKPSDWILERELREYKLADRILVLSSFSAQSFLDEGVRRERLALLPLGVDVRAFQAAPDALEQRIQRIREGQPLTVVYVGALSFRKGLWDLGTLTRSVDAGRFRFLMAGQVLPEARQFVTTFGSHVQLLGKIPQHQLPDVYRQGDLFVFPTIEDGFPVVLAQARAARLPIITTPNGAGSDIVESARQGWIVPIRSPRAIAERLEWCDGNRDALAEMIAAPEHASHSRDWADVARDFESICFANLSRGREPVVNRGH